MVSRSDCWCPQCLFSQGLITSPITLLVCLPSQVFRGSLSPTPNAGLHQSVSSDDPSRPELGVNTLIYSCIKASSLLLRILFSDPGRVRTRRQSSGSTGGPSTPLTDSRGRSRAKVVSQSQRMYTQFTSVHTISLVLQYDHRDHTKYFVHLVKIGNLIKFFIFVPVWPHAWSRVPVLWLHKCFRL